MQSLHFKTIPSFDKDLKKLSKRFGKERFIQDLENAKKYSIVPFHRDHLQNNGIVLLQECASETIQIYKVRKVACRALPNRGAQSGIRIIYAFNVRTLTIIFLEIYFKGDQENETKERIKAYFRSH